MNKNILFLIVFTTIFCFSGCPAKDKELNNIRSDKCLNEEDGEICYSIAYSHIKDGELINPEQFRKWSELGCEYGSLEACYSLGTFWRKGDGGEADKEMACKYYNKGCKKNKLGLTKIVEDSCFMYATMKSAGDGCLKDIDGAIEIYKMLCENKDMLSCQRLGDIFLYQKDEMLKKSISYYDKGCSNNFLSSCVGAGIVMSKLGKLSKIRLYLEKSEKLIHSATANDFYNIACLFSENGDVEKSLNYLSKAIKIDEEFVEKAKNSEYFLKVREDERFKVLLEHQDR
jgi:tetratricopeptide (TPR) repeat protein